MTNRQGLYIHVPFCSHRCSYCDFFSKTGAESLDGFVERLLVEAKQMAEWWRQLGNGVRMDTIFFGGGTPSLLPAGARGQVLSVLRERFDVSSEAEITLEANPEHITRPFLERLRQDGVNRLSLGVQSFQPRFLRRLDRRVSVGVVSKAIECLHGHGGWNWSLDLIMGIPGQTVALLRDDLNQAIAASPSHLSVYSLTLKPGHRLYAELPGEELCARLFETAALVLVEAGYEHYEISNFARPAKRCRHNLLYWDGGNFVGLGPTAASRYYNGVFWHRTQPSSVTHSLNPSNIREIPFEPTTRFQSALEAAFLELRKDCGVCLDDFARRYGVDLSKSRRFSDFKQGGFVRVDAGRLRLTRKGRMLADSVTSGLIDSDRSSL